jgi:hypothetical protein
MAERDTNSELSTADLVDRTNEATPTEAPERRAEESPPTREDMVDREESLIESQDADALRERWERLQTGFVDEPRRSVEEADGLVADVLRRVAESFSSARVTLEEQWTRGEEVSTEDLRQILQRYRSFFNRLLSA